jgi:hypothetical protein
MSDMNRLDKKIQDILLLSTTRAEQLEQIKSLINEEVKRIVEKCVPDKKITNINNSFCEEALVPIEIESYGEGFNECRKQMIDNVEKEIGR